MADIPSAIKDICLRYQAVLLAQNSTMLKVAVTGEPAKALTDALHFAFSGQVEFISWNEDKMALWQEKYADATQTQCSNLPTPAEKLNQILALGLKRRASDIHIEPQSESIRIRLRIDGVLQVAGQLTPEHGLAIVTRLKVLSRLDIAERRLPQDGQFTHVTQTGEHVSFRLSTLPTQYGEKVVLRLLNNVHQTPQLETLGMPARALKEFRAALSQPQGLILVTGPTGSGKTITLYSGLNWLNQPGRNISSIEDPVEIPLAGVIQTQINHKTGYDFQQVLKALLRQDPDVIMLGEIRDPETALITINAAQTGHLVLSTLHTNSTLETLTRLKQMGLPGYQLGPALRMIIAQRLLRRLCPHCRQPGKATGHFPSTIWPGTAQNWLATGCPHCFSGFYGRLALFEVLPVTSRLQNAIVNEAPLEALADIASKQGLSQLFTEGLHAVNRGDTTLEELLRVTGYGEN